MVRIKVLLITAVMFFFFCPTAYADEIDEFAEKIGSEVSQGLPDNVRQELSDMDISLEKPESLSEISVQDVIGSVKDSFTEGLARPCALLGRIIGIMLICSIALSLSDNETNADRIFETITVMAIVVLCFDLLYEACGKLIAMLTSLGGFMSTYLPVFVSVSATSTGAATASGGSAALLVLAEIIAVCAGKVLPLVCSVMLSVTIAQSVSPSRDYSIAAAIRKLLNKIIAFASTLFVGIISVTGIVAASADTVAVRCAKFTASSFVPVIGSAVSEAYTTVRGSLSLLRSATGAFGIVAVVLIALGPVLSSVGLCLTVNIAKAVAGMFSLKAPKAFLGGVGELLSVVMTFSILLSMMFVVSTAVLMLCCVNV